MSFTDQNTQEYDDFGSGSVSKNDSYEPKSNYQNATDKQAAAAANAVEAAADRAQGRNFETIDKGVSARSAVASDDSNLRVNEARQMQTLNSQSANSKSEESQKDRNQRANELSTQISDNIRSRASQEAIASGANTTSQENAKTAAKAQVSAALYGRKQNFGGYW